jgi:rare lipoprotein A
MKEEGMASWYGNPYHGRAAASGEIYDMDQMTAAHRTLPFQTWVRVHDLDNGKTVDVRINDRGPFVDGRIIDLSHAAARSISMIGPGIAKVQIEVIKVPADAAPARYAVQVGAFRDVENAKRFRERLEKQYGTARAVKREGNPTVWRVLVGTETTEAGAETLAARVREEQKVRAAFVVRLDL